MPVINIYLDEELFEFVKKDKSRIVQQALEEFRDKQLHKQNDTPSSCSPTPAP